MNRNIVIKTVLICTGIFLLISSVSVYLIFSRYGLDTEKYVNVAYAGVDISEGSVIDESMLGVKAIRESAANGHMVDNIRAVTGSRALNSIRKGDYIRGYELLPAGMWNSDSHKTVILPLDMEGRLANLVKKGSIVDIKAAAASKRQPPELVLSKVVIMDMLDENGLSTDSHPGGRKAYAVLFLDSVRRDRLYAAMQEGKLLIELYGSRLQEPAAESYEISR